MNTLKDLFLNELADIYDAERRIVKALPKIAKQATCNELKETIHVHLKETESHIKKLEQVFQSFGIKPRGKTCEATIGLLEEGERLAEEFKGSPAINAALVSAALKIEYYEVASYKCLSEWATLLGNKESQRLLKEILDEEKKAGDSLTKLARSKCNDEALGKAPKQESEVGASNKSKWTVGSGPRSRQKSPRSKRLNALA